MMSTPLRVLMVEDSPDDALLLARELRRGGYEPFYERVETAEGLRLALESGPWDLIISDYNMPSFRATEALQMLRDQGMDAPFVVVSGSVGEEIAVETMRAGANDYVMKDKLTRLSSAVTRELRETEARRRYREAEEALKHSEQRFRSLVEQAADAIFVLDAEGNIVDANRHACKSLGYSREELLAMSVLEVEAILPHGSLAEAWKAVRSGTPFTMDAVYRRKDGTTFPVEIRIGVFEEERRLMIFVARDVTERRESERRLGEAETRYRVVAETASDAIVMIDEESRILFANGAAEKTFGYGQEEMLGQELTMLMPERLRDGHRAALRRYLDTGRRRLDWEAIQLPGLHQSGREVPIEVSFGEFVKDGHRFFTGFIRDISERLRAEEDLRRSEERFRATFEQAAVGMAIVAPNGCWLRVNDRLCGIVGYGREELMGLTFQDITHPEDLDADLGHVRSLLAGETHTYSMEKRYLRKDGPVVWIELTVSLVREASGEPEYFIAVIEDITDRKLAEQRVREAREAERVRIAQDIHDDTLQSMIYALQEIQLLQITSVEDGVRDGRNAVLDDVANALRRSVEGLRSAIFELRLEDTLNQSFTTSLRALVELTRRMSRGRFELSLEVDEGFPSELSRWAGGELIHILQEALNNARRHSGSRDISVRLWREGETAFTEVADDGKGFDARSSGGGVGMSSMRRRALTLGGELTMKSEPGSGTRVRFEAPIARLLEGQASVPGG